MHRLTFLVLVTGVIAGCHRQERLLVTGSSTVAPVLQEAAERLESLRPGLEIDVQTGGSTRGILDACAGENDLGMVSRDLTDEERRDLTVLSIASDGVAFIVHADNPVARLSREQVRDVFTGKVRRWEDLGGCCGSITVVNKAAGRATLEVFLAYSGLESGEVRADAVIGDNAQGIRLVSRLREAIGYVSLGEALHARELGTRIRLVSLDGVAPELAAVASGEWPVSRTLGLVWKGQLKPRARELIDYLQSAAGRTVIESLRFVPRERLGAGESP